MIPQCFPTSYISANGKTKMKVNELVSTSGLKEWIDFIPVQSVLSYGGDNYNNNGAIEVEVLADLTGLQAGKDYINIYEDGAKTVAWSSSNNGYIPIYNGSP